MYALSNEPYFKLVYRIEHHTHKAGLFHADDIDDLCDLADNEDIDLQYLLHSLVNHCRTTGLREPDQDFKDPLFELKGDTVFGLYRQSKTPDWVFGTNSLATLRKWLPATFVEDFEKLGFVVSVYDVPNYCKKESISGDQVYFYPEFRYTQYPLSILHESVVSND